MKSEQFFVRTYSISQHCLHLFTKNVHCDLQLIQGNWIFGVCISPQRLDGYLTLLWRGGGVDYALHAFHMQVYPLTVMTGTGCLQRKTLPHISFDVYSLLWGGEGVYWSGGEDRNNTNVCHLVEFQLFPSQEQDICVQLLLFCSECIYHMTVLVAQFIVLHSVKYLSSSTQFIAKLYLLSCRYCQIMYT